jgi:hypothetical protein
MKIDGFIYNDGVYTIEYNFKYITMFKGEWIEINIPSGFSWNGVTGFKTTTKTLVPSMVHDWLIYDKRINGSKVFTRKDMDMLFLNICKINDVPRLSRLLFRIALNVNRNVLMKLEKKQK